MSVFDIRDKVFPSINTIVFADAQHGSYINATQLINTIGGVIRIYDEEDDFVCITSLEHTENLIKALQKAIELKWVE